MKRSGFTMVELIFVIVIIGILAAVALPKFGGVKDKAKSNTEISGFNSLESAITAEVEFRIDDFGDTNVNWHQMDDGDFNQTAQATKVSLYNTINTNNEVLRKILKKGKNIKIAGFWGVNTTGSEIQGNDNGASSNDILILRGPASDPLTGVAFSNDATNSDFEASPDKNDMWIFNPNNFDINITSNNARTELRNPPVTVEARSIAIIDVLGTYTNANNLVTDLRAVSSTGTIAPQAPRLVQ